jgi:uncharacterized protein (DUF58 family)
VSAPTPPPRLTWSPRAFLVAGFGGFLVIAAVALRDPVPLFVALPLLFAPLVVALTGVRRTAECDLRWLSYGSAREVEVVGALAPQHPSEAPDLVVEFSRPANLLEAAPPETTVDRGEVTFRLHWRAVEPMVATVPAPTVVWRDPTGIAEVRPVRPHDGLVVERFPPELLRLGRARLEHTLALPGETRSRRIGASGEFYGLREAVPTDPPRRINWRATARAGRVLANEFEVDRTGDVLLVVDARPSSLGRAVDERLLGIARAAAFGVADSFLRQKARVGYAAFGEFLEPVPLAGGRTQRLRIRSAIGATQLSSVAGPSERCAVSVRRFFPNGVTTIVFTSLYDEASFDLLPHLRRRGYPVAVLSPSPIPALPRAPPLAPEVEALADRLLSLDRRASIARAWQDAPVIDWHDYWSLGGLVGLLRHPRRSGAR